jgi:pimeloyl-ACP methyl ester carboxylesterase
MISIRLVGPQQEAGRPDPLLGERVEFASRKGNLLVGDLHRSGRRHDAAIILCHGMESTRGGTKQLAMVERFVPQGYTVLRFDFSYVGESEGRFEDMTISGEVADALGAIDFLYEFSPSSCVLVGSSLGGTVALLAAAHAAQRVDGVATIAAVGDTSLFVSELNPGQLAEWRSTGRRRLRDEYLNVDFLDDVESLDIAAAVATIRRPLLVLHGEADDVVPVEHARLIAQACPGPVRTELFPGVAHRIEEPGALARLLDTLDRWLSCQVHGQGADSRAPGRRCAKDGRDV